MASTPPGLGWLQPFDQSADPPAPRWIVSRWYGTTILLSAICNAAAGVTAVFALMAMPIVDSAYTVGLLAVAAAISLGVAVAEWRARLRQRARNTLVIAALGTSALVAIAIGGALGS